MKEKQPDQGRVWREVRRLAEAGMPVAQAARSLGVGVSAAYSRARREGWKRPEPEAADGGKGLVRSGAGLDESAAALDECQHAVTRALRKAARDLMKADADIAKAMEPVDRALKLKRELAKERREQGGTTVVVETLIPVPPASGEEE